MNTTVKINLGYIIKEKLVACTTNLKPVEEMIPSFPAIQLVDKSKDLVIQNSFKNKIFLIIFFNEKKQICHKINQNKLSRGESNCQASSGPNLVGPQLYKIFLVPFSYYQREVQVESLLAVTIFCFPQLCKTKTATQNWLGF